MLSNETTLDNKCSEAVENRINRRLRSNCAGNLQESTVPRKVSGIGSFFSLRRWFIDAIVCRFSILRSVCSKNTGAQPSCS